MSEGLSALRDDAAAQSVFARIVWAARRRSNLLARDVAAVEAALQLARFHAWHVAPAEAWAGGRGHVKLLVHSLAQHLVGRYPVPRVFGAAWFGDDSAPRDEERWWFIEHASGRPFRKVEGLPLPVTRKMERILLQSPADLSLRAAIRRAELLALGAEPGLLQAIARTELGEDLEQSEFWRPVLHWLVRHQESLAPAQVGPIVEFLYAVGLRGRTVWTPGGQVHQPPQPDFSLAGRTPESLWRLVSGWRRDSAQAARRPGRTWSAAGWIGLRFYEHEADPRAAVWEIVELRTGEALRAEGRALRHCVGSYMWRCIRRCSSIWTLRRAPADGVFEPRYTIEVEPHSRKIVQIRGLANRRATGLARRIIARWAEQERLELLACA